MVRAHTLAGLVASFACAVGAFAQGYSFTVLESTEPNVATSRGVMARAISGNGRVIAGTSAQWQLPNPPYQFVELPYVWIQQNNGTWQRRDLPMLGRPDVPPEQALPMGRPLSINFDGSIIGGTVGPRVTTMAWNPGVAGVWTNVLGQDVQVAHAVPNDPFEARSYICGMSRDGQTMLTFSQTMPSGSGELLLISGADVSDVGGLDQQWFAANLYVRWRLAFGRWRSRSAHKQCALLELATTSLDVCRRGGAPALPNPLASLRRVWQRLGCLRRRTHRWWLDRSAHGALHV
jgi:hypothetical protein